MGILNLEEINRIESYAWLENGGQNQFALEDLIETAKKYHELNSAINTPEINDFAKAIQLEAVHQRLRWGTSHDAGKTPADWFWLIGYLAGKALHAQTSLNKEKALHHIITTAAACLNWHSAINGKTDMRPGIDSSNMAI